MLEKIDWEKVFFIGGPTALFWMLIMYHMIEFNASQ